MIKVKEPVRLRQRKQDTGNVSLYLDIYVQGKRTYEYLRLYLIPEKSRADKEKNRQTLQLAEAIRAKRLVELREGTYGFNHRQLSNVRFFDYFRIVMSQKRKKDSMSSYGLWNCLYRYLKGFEKRENITFAEITPEWVKGFKAYIDKANAFMLDERERNENRPLSENTKFAYYSRLKTLFNHAIKDNIIQSNPANGLESFRAEEGTRMYLTVQEVKKLAATECKNDCIKKAFLFSCLTGLRKSDILRLTWNEVHQQGDFTRIIFKQKKTSGLEYLDITAEAADLMGERKEPESTVFRGLLCTHRTNQILKEWVKEAGIDKDITFHCGRHTFATMMLDLGTDIYTVSKLLGHRELATTQIYAKVIDKNKQAAILKIPSVLSTE